MWIQALALGLSTALAAIESVAAEKPYWVEPMRAAHAGFHGNQGYVAQFGDSITYSMAFWTPIGWDEPDTYLGKDDGLPKRPNQKRWRDAIKGFRAKGGGEGNYSGWRVGDVLGVIDAVLNREQPEAAIIMIGTNDISGGRVPADYRSGLKTIVQKCLEAHCVPILNTIPPRVGHDAAVDAANRLVREVARECQVPLADFYAECLRLRPGQSWQKTIISDDGVHPSGGKTNVYTDENMKVCGYALRNWVNFLALREVYFLVLTAANEPVAGWVNVTNNVGGAKWGAYGVHYMTAVPGSDAVIAGVSECGLWKTTDGGKVWKKLGGNEIKCRPSRIVFDPQNPAVFWVSGCYGDAPFRTDDGGKTFQRLGHLAHADGVAVDFGDPQRKTLLLGLHEQSQSLQMSNDGGNTWTRIGDKLPADSNHSSDPIIIDSKTFLINTAGWKQHASLGIYRSEDAGKTWTCVSTFGPQGPPLLASDGAIYWQRIWGGGLLKSADQGKTWKALSTAVKDNPVELPKGRLAGMSGRQLLVSSDGGLTWKPLGPPAPFKPNAIIYSEKGKCFYAWHLSDNMKMDKQSIVRLQVE